MDGAAPGHIYFNTDALPQRDRFPAVREEFARRLLAIDVNTDDPAAFSAVFDIKCTAQLALAYIDTSAGDYVRTSELIRDDLEFLFLTVPLQGPMFISQPSVGDCRTAGQAVILDSTHIGGIHFNGRVHYLTMRIPRSQIASRVAPNTRFPGNPMNKDAAACRLLLSYLSATRHIDWRNAGRAAELHDQHILDLLVLTLGVEGDPRQLAQERGLRAVRRSEILRAIERRSGDAELSAAKVAADFGITPRYVHQLLEDTGLSFTHHVRERRLNRALALLRNPARRRQRITDIAAEAGFTDLSYFNRAFRRRFGASPSDIREQSLRDLSFRQ